MDLNEYLGQNEDLTQSKDEHQLLITSLINDINNIRQVPYTHIIRFRPSRVTAFQPSATCSAASPRTYPTQ